MGAGVAGLTAARELFRSGFANIDIYEASDRIGGRTYSQTSPMPGDITTFEMGAMRVPFFGTDNSVMAEYCSEFDITIQPFPNPGVKDVSTGIYINRGYGTKEPLEPDNPAAPKSLISWKWSSRKKWEPDDKELRRIQKKWSDFATKFKEVCEAAYADGSTWPQVWQAIVAEYQGINFRQLVMARPRRGKTPGKFGGVGLNAVQARILAVVGLGDGGWGAFYDISSLYVLRVVMFGFYDDLQLIVGALQSGDTAAAYAEKPPRDSLGQELTRPRFLGVQSLAECLFYKRSSDHRGQERSLYEAIDSSRGGRSGVHLYTQTPVRRIRRLQNGPPKIRISTDAASAFDYDEVIVTAMPWSLEVEAAFDRFRPSQLPWSVRNAMKSSHFITSCKVFFPLKELYWLEPRNPIPQVIVTDTFLQGAYGISVNGNEALRDRGYKGVLLASYTWEDDATKLIADDDEVLAARCLDELDGILIRCGMGRISPYVINTPRVFHWAQQPNYRGCARLYRPGSWELDQALLRYNQDYSGKSHLHLAGEAYSVEGGWVEPALRSALDAVVHLIHNRNGTFRNEFNFAIYPRH